MYVRIMDASPLPIFPAHRPCTLKLTNRAAIEGEMREGANASLWARLKERGEACAAALAPPAEVRGSHLCVCIHRRETKRRL